MKKQVTVRATKPYRSAQSVLLRLFSVSEGGHETLIATSSPIHKVVAMEVHQRLTQPCTIAPDLDSLKDVFQIPGKTAWASAIAPDAQAAALQACLQHNMKSARGVLIILTLSPYCGIVASIKSAMNVIQWEAPLLTARALMVTHDDTLHSQVRLKMLLMGL